MSSLARLVHVQVGDIPTGDLEIIWVDHGHDVFNWLENILESVVLLVVLVADMCGSALGERSVEVRVLNSSLGFPRLLLLVGKNNGGESGTVVSSESDKHDSDLWNFGISLDLVGDGLDGLLVGF